MAECLEDLSSTATGDSGERLLADNEWGKIKTIHQQSGFRDGISTSSDLHVQEGFKDGFQSALHHSINTGYLKGLISPHQIKPTEHSSQFCGQLDQLIKSKHPEHVDQRISPHGAMTVEEFINIHQNLYKQCTILCYSVSKPLQST